MLNKSSAVKASMENKVFSTRKQKFKECIHGLNVLPAKLILSCSDEYHGLCWQACPKCGSTSLKKTFSKSSRVLKENCDFTGVRAILLFTRPIVDRFMSAYGQITFQGYKRKEKREEAERNKYALVDPNKNAVLRLTLFLDAVEDEKKKKADS